MKKLVIFLLAFVLTTLPSFAQNVTVSADRQPLKTVLKAIQDQTDYKFVYNTTIVDANQLITVKASKEPLRDVLDKVFAGTGIVYQISDKLIMLSPKNQQNRQPVPVGRNVSGSIFDESGEPLAGVYVTSTSGGSSVSDGDGRFSLPAGSDDMLTFSFLGMQTVTTKADSRRVMNVVMKSEVVSLEDVVVTGYQTISKERATGSFNIVKTDQLEKPTSNIAQRLVGTTSGVQSTTDAEGNVSFQIRGQTSLMANAQPLVVVDGFPIQGDFNSINPNDVESVSILKDAAAASIWGARSANGVIVVTTKRGANLKKGEVRVNAQIFWKYSPKIDWSYVNPLATSAETVEYEKKGYSTQGYFGCGYVLPPTDSYYDYSATSLAVEALNERQLGYISESDMNARLNQLSNQNNSDQIKKYMLSNPFTRQYNFDIEQASERATNVLSLMYEHRDMELKGNDQGKYNVGYRTNVKLFSWLDFSFDGNYNLTKSNNNATSLGELQSMSPYQMLLNSDGSRNYEQWGSYDYGTFYIPNIKRNVPYSKFPYSDWSYNPITEREGRNYKTDLTDVRAQLGLTFHLLPGMTFDTKLQYEYIDSYTKNINDESTGYVRTLINTACNWDKETNTVTSNLPKGGVMTQSKYDVNSYNWRNQLNYDNSWCDGKHQLTAILGTEVSNIVTQSTNYPTTYGYNDNTLTVGKFPNGVGGSGVYRLYNWQGWTQSFNYTNSYSYATERYFSLYANASYTLNHKYTLSASARTDASNLITDDPKYRYAPFWSVGGSWIMSDEDFMQGIGWLDRLIVRGTYGYNGNVDRSTSFMPLISVSTTQNSYIQDYTARISSYGNPTLRWEKTGTVDLGADFSMFKGKLYGKLDLYNKKGRDLIVDMSIPSVNGTTSQSINAAEMTNRGVELELGSALDIMDKDITWNGSLNFSYNYNHIDKLFKSYYMAYYLCAGGTYSYVQGHDANALWSFKYAGVQNVGTETSPVMRPVVQGKGTDVYQFNTWTPGDGRDYMLDSGTLTAPYSLGFTSNFKVFDFDVSMVVTGKFGHVFRGFSFNYPSMFFGSALPNKAYSEVVNADPSKMVPIPWDGEFSYYFWDRFYPYLDYLVQNAGNVRLQEINVSYNVPASFLRRINLKKATIYAQGNNLLVLSHNKYNEDPEFPLGNLKPSAAYTFGVNFTF
jgi:TonB-linked SusC/RagA family outer membrane protein